jgi:hypothetical protein
MISFSLKKNLMFSIALDIEKFRRFQSIVEETRNLPYSQLAQHLNESEPNKNVEWLSDLYEQSYQTALIFLECSEKYQRITTTLTELLQRIQKTSEFFHYFLQNLQK